MPGLVRWTFSDGGTPYTFEINPSEGGSPARKSNLVGKPTTAPDGQVLLYEGQPEPQTLSWSGTILTQSHYEALDLWADKKVPVTLVDDLSRTFVIKITLFDPKRVRSAVHPWKHTYTCEATIL